MYLKFGIIGYIITTICIAVYKLLVRNESYEAVNFFIGISILVLMGVITSNVIYGVPW